MRLLKDNLRTWINIGGDGAVGSVLVDCAGDASSNSSINKKKKVNTQ